ncbi:MaoC family dehydratase [Limnochorda pilosa]|uniref:Enoyl-CoA hydratase n=1 Tax=Limnochorda pilosa TaxID=1555112 RepID=A0A0K2SPD3_LIMPI|nr:MaoC family dehydratase [Limnochorda pilosa]BAS28985.1 enoyl-CoA hydratase [Limnochorda pilosa]
MQHIARRKSLGRHVDELQVGEKATFTQKVEERDVYLYMGLTNDLNPVYVDREYAHRTELGEPVVPGILVAAQVVAAITGRLPGPGTITAHQTLRFASPAHCGDVLTTELEVVSLDPAANRATLKSVTHNQEGKPVLLAESEVIPPPRLRSVLTHAFEDYD